MLQKLTRPGKGRTGKNLQDLKKIYKIKIGFEEDETKIKHLKNKKGKFITATNEIKLDNNKVLKRIQRSTDRGKRVSDS